MAVQYGTSKKNCLVVLLHGYASKVSSYDSVKYQISKNYPNAEILIPRLGLHKFSNADPNKVVNSVIKLIDKKYESHRYEEIVLIGHSSGALLARKIYVYACGENDDSPFELFHFKKTRIWASKVSRIVLMAGMNRGWTVNRHLSFVNSVFLKLGIAVGDILSLFNYNMFIFKIRKGAPFITQLRLQWLSMLNGVTFKKIGNAVVVQMLGSIDDLVSPDDNIDLITGNNFYYLEVPFSGHVTVRDMDDTYAGRKRAEVFASALLTNTTELEKLQIDSFEQQPLMQRNDVTDVVFVIHGIRDAGFWTKKIGSRVQKLGSVSKRIFETETSSYGYFPMLSFLFYATRRAKVEWLMDQYTENKARYPMAQFSFIGHSNGTYLLARALEDYPACKFKHIVFAGSVVRQGYNWNRMIANRRIQGILNLVASADLVVAIFPKAFQTLQIQDIGSGGHDGFSSLSSNCQLRYLKGSHGAGIKEELWDTIANYIVNGSTAAFPANICIKKQNGFVKILGLLSPLILLAIIGLLGLVGYGIKIVLKDYLVLQTIFIGLYLIIIWKVITKL
ncbi:alpha/beta hydrolase [Flavihumibacter sp. R14]|nr:alpha/beta hydrolase [Flavihumibacter soli]